MTDPMILRLIVLTGLLFVAGGAGLSLRRYFRNAELPLSFDRGDLDVTHADPMLVEFTSPFCYECQVALPVLQSASTAHGAQLAVVDARDRPDLAAKYAIRSTPTILLVDPSGRVTHGWMNAAPSAQELTAALSRR